jgi:hypothetical protein
MGTYGERLTARHLTPSEPPLGLVLARRKALQLRKKAVRCPASQLHGTNTSISASARHLHFNVLETGVLYFGRVPDCQPWTLLWLLEGLDGREAACVSQHMMR